MFLLFMSIWAVAIAILIGVAVYRARAVRPGDVVIQPVVTASSDVDNPSGESDKIDSFDQFVDRFRRVNPSVDSIGREYADLMYARAAQAFREKEDFDSFIFAKYAKAYQDFDGKLLLQPSDDQRQREELIRRYLVVIREGRAQMTRGGKVFIPKI